LKDSFQVKRAANGDFPFVAADDSRNLLKLISKSGTHIIRPTDVIFVTSQTELSHHLPAMKLEFAAGSGETERDLTASSRMRSTDLPKLATLKTHESIEIHVKPKQILPERKSFVLVKNQTGSFNDGSLKLSKEKSVNESEQ
jgi:hypothetical protein